MTRSSTSKIESFDPEIERTFHKLRNIVGKILSPRNQLVKMEKTPAPVGVAVGAAWVENSRRTLMEYAQPSINGTASCIRKSVV